MKELTTILGNEGYRIKKDKAGKLVLMDNTGYIIGVGLKNVRRFQDFDPRLA